VFLAELLEMLLSIVTEWRMAYVMPQGDGLNQILIESKQTSDTSSDFGHHLNV